jgi:hypothetical protein
MWWEFKTKGKSIRQKGAVLVKIENSKNNTKNRKRRGATATGLCCPKPGLN